MHPMKFIVALILALSVFGIVAYHAGPAQAEIDTDGQGNVKGNK
jgi:hypothetical protein